VDPRAFDVLREVVKRVKGEYFVSFDADGTWGPVVSSPPLLKRVLVWVYKRPDVVEALIDYYTRIAIAYGECSIDEGADAIQLCVDYGSKSGPWLSPRRARFSQHFSKHERSQLHSHDRIREEEGDFLAIARNASGLAPCWHASFPGVDDGAGSGDFPRHGYSVRCARWHALFIRDLRVIVPRGRA
jgi:hypothetical protein